MSSPASPVPLSGTVYLGPRGDAGEPTSAAPWPLFALVQGAGLRIKFAASLYYDTQGAIRLQLQGLPELPFQHVRLTTDAGFLRNPATCGIHEGTAELVGYSGATNTSHPSLTVSGCSGALSGGGAFAPVTDRSQASLCQIGGRSSCPVGPASHSGTPHLRASSLAGSEITYVAGLGQTNVVTVVQNPTTYTITDSGISTFPDADGAGGCTVAGATATCPRDGVTLVVIEVLDGNDTVDGGPENDYILGGDGGDALDGFEGDDTIDTGLGDPLFEFFDSANGGTGFNTITFASRPAGGSGVMIDNRPDRDFAIDTDGSSESMDAMQVLIGTPNDDEMIGAYASEVLVGGAGQTPCVAASATTRSTTRRAPCRCASPWTATCRPTRTSGSSCFLTTRRERRGAAAAVLQGPPRLPQTDPATGLPVTPGDRDCTADDGPFNPTHRGSTDNDCVGEDVENIIGSDSDDILIGNDTDPLEGRGPRIEPLGANRIEGRGGNDVMDGRSGPDVYEGGAGTDTVTYDGLEAAGRTFSGRTTRSMRRSMKSDVMVAHKTETAPDVSDDVGLDVEKLIGGSANDTLIGGDADDQLVGGDGDDFLVGGTGWISSTEDRPTTGSRAAAATTAHRRERVEIASTVGRATMPRRRAGRRLARWRTRERLARGGDGIDTADYSGAQLPLQIDLALAGVQDTGGAGSDSLASLENLTGGSANDILRGDSGQNTLRGGAGNDRIDARDLVQDQVLCEEGSSDLALVDELDITAGCEGVDDGSAPVAAATRLRISLVRLI